MNIKQKINLINSINDNVDHYSMNASYLQNEDLICFDINQKYSLFFDKKMNLVAKLHFDAYFNSYEDSENIFKFSMYNKCRCVLVIFDQTYRDMFYEEFVLFYEDSKIMQD